MIKGWDVGVATMRKGEKCILTCMPDYAYGESGSGSIPPNAVLQFEVELFRWHGEDVTKDGGVYISFLNKSSTHSKPSDGSTVNGRTNYHVTLCNCPCSSLKGMCG